MAQERLQVILQLIAGQYKSEARQAASATGQIGKQATATGTATGKLDQKMGAFARTAKFAVAGAATAAVVKFGKDSAQAFLGFDDAMNQSLAIMGDVSESMRGDMADAAREIGRTTRIGAEEAAEAYFFLASAGLDAEQSIAALPQVAQFAQAGMFNMATATDLATDAQSALGLAVPDAAQNLENLTRVTDTLVGANTLANASVQQFSEALTNRAGAAMRAVGIDIEEGTAVLAAFADQGVKGAEAGTQFAIVLRDLQTRALENKEAFEAAGVAVFDQQGNLRNFADILGDLESRFQGMSAEQKRAELSTLGFTDRSIAAITVLLGTSDAIRANEAALRDMGGATKDVADKQLGSFQGKMELLRGRMEDLQITVGEALVPSLIALTDVAVSVAEQIGNILGPVGDLIGLLDRIKLASDDAGGQISLLDAATGTFGETVGNVAFFGLPNLIEGLENFFGGAEESTEATKELSGEFSTLGGEMNQIPDAARAAADGMTDAERAARTAFAPIENLGGAVDRQGGKWDDVITSMEDYETMLRRLTDPVFAAVNDQRRLEEATQDYLDVIDDPDATIGEQDRAMWGLVEAQIAAEESAAALPEDLEAVATHIEIVGRRAKITEEDLGRLRDMIMEFDGLKANATVNVNVVGGQKITGGNINTDIGLRQHGGPVRAGSPYVVGEAGPELFIPQQSGMVVSNQQMTSTGVAAGGQTINVFTLTWADFVRKSADAGLEIQRYGW